MSIKLVDKLESMGDFPVADADGIQFEDGENLQDKLDKGKLGAGGASYTELSQEEYNALSDEEKLNGQEYRTYDTGKIYKLGVEYGKETPQRVIGSLAELNLTTDASLQDITNAMPQNSLFIFKVDAMSNKNEYYNITTGTVSIYKLEQSRIQAFLTNKTDGRTWVGQVGTIGNSDTIVGWSELGKRTYYDLSELGLTNTATLNEVINQMPVGSSALFGVTEFADYQTLFPYEDSNDQYSRVFIVKSDSSAIMYVKWFRKDGAKAAYGKVDGNNQVIGWERETLNPYNANVYRTFGGISVLNTAKGINVELVANEDNTLKIIQALGSREEFIDWFNNTSNRFGINSQKYGNRINYFRIVKFSSTDGTAMAIMNSGAVLSRIYTGGALSDWAVVDTSKTTLVTNTSTLKLEVTKRNSAWFGAIKLTYLYDTSPVEVEISFRSVTDNIRWAVINGQKYINKITYAQDSNNTAHYTIGIEFAGTTYGCYQAEVIGGFADINSFTSNAFTGDKTAVYNSPWGKNNGVTLITAPEDLGLTFPCTTVQLAQAMRNKFSTGSGAIGIFNHGNTSGITDAPSDYGLLHIECIGYDRLLIRFDGIGASQYKGSWIGEIASSGATFSSVTWIRQDNNYSTTETVVGTWIDGKPIYRKCWKFDNIDSTYYNNTLESIGIDTIVNVGGSYQTGGVMLSIPHTYEWVKLDYDNSTTSTATQYAKVNYDTNTNQLKLVMSSGSTITKAVVFVEYTKA